MAPPLFHDCTILQRPLNSVSRRLYIYLPESPAGNLKLTYLSAAEDSMICILHLSPKVFFLPRVFPHGICSGVARFGMCVSALNPDRFNIVKKTLWHCSKDNNALYTLHSQPAQVSDSNSSSFSCSTSQFAPETARSP